MQPGPEGHEGVLEIGERQFLISPGDGAQAPRWRRRPRPPVGTETG